ncbi:myosin IF [Cavenderia fasciculata]|uniref:Myosin IF n=1 Tax=Cavenderia fasciculata TaxID=261658 RepID=F4Q3L7_CACFS|nr:myosin IF [Cavenderia fasciculata]EGG17675.1 myosin IF [Cavenderia fasciculata]|eukprot:XP_004356159.1 myosin IF [Cavenderia fasciculata]
MSQTNTSFHSNELRGRRSHPYVAIQAVGSWKYISVQGTTLAWESGAKIVKCDATKIDICEKFQMHETDNIHVALEDSRRNFIRVKPNGSEDGSGNIQTWERLKLIPVNGLYNAINDYYIQTFHGNYLTEAGGNLSLTPQPTTIFRVLEFINPFTSSTASSSSSSSTTTASSSSTNIYSTQSKQSFRNKYMYECPPHIYALAEDTYKKLLLTKENQCVIITGESGAGKTEASKIFMDYISFCSSKINNNNNNDIMKKVIDSNVLLEAFGNAKTIRNDNSSRFGKFINLQFDVNGIPVGAKINQYLIEKSRVNTRAHGERNFHIFYQFLTNHKLTERYGLSGDSSIYKCLSNSDCFKVDTINDKKLFDNLLDSMNGLGWNDHQQDAIWRVIAAILLIGNLDFESDTEKSTVDAVVVSTPDVLKRICLLLQCNQDSLEKALISRSLTTGAGKRASSIRVLLDYHQACNARDSLARVLYERLFGHILDRLNTTLKPKDRVHVESMIGILDIYGFEVFQNNSFEQFIINYANEKLQQLFIHLVLRQEQEDYEKEGINWVNINYFDNAPVIELIEGHPVGLFKLLEESCLVGQATPETLMNKFNQFFDKHPFYQSFEQTLALSPSSPQSFETPVCQFTVKHYAGKVTYDLTHFLAKNRDSLHHDLLLAVETSKNDIIHSIYSISEQLKISNSKRMPMTSAQQFKVAINELISILLTCQPHYIRCIKSNDQKKSNYFDHERVLDQIRYLNTVDTVKVIKAGFANKWHYNRFFSRFSITCNSTWPIWDKSIKEGVEEIIKNLISNVNERNQQCVFGRKKLFIKSAKTLFLFEKIREDNLPKAVVIIQKLWRGHQARVWFQAEKRRLQEEKEEIQRQLARKRAVQRIQSVYQRYKIRSFIKKLGQWIEGPYYNKGRPMPALWTCRRPIDDMMQVMHITWWAKVKVSKLTLEQRALVRQKILCLDLFGGGYLKKKPWEPKRRFMADYMSNDSNPKKQQFTEAIQNLFPKGEDKEILFADNVIKVNKRGKSQLRTLIITDQHIYKYDPKKYKKKKEGLKIHMIVALSASNKRDTFMSIHFKQPIRDLFIDLGCEGVEKVSEAATILVQQVYKLTRTSIPLLLREPVTFNNSRDSRHVGQDWVVSFSPYPRGKESQLCTFNKGKGNAAIVYYPPE